ncbi:hypothetical protein [Microbacterium oxydans]|uniref:hypothetical protein n=1 Tax=Microbacterium oxydans TaxID=82380 RepID=UPI000F8FB65E|nr:hypothetical protein [Microbacterium oxydans]AZS46660.1 hypothetical protein CVS53_01334 [Microbacterium oxydans]
MEMQEGFRPDEAPISAALYTRFEHRREEIRSLRRDAAATHGDDLDAYKRAIILEAEVDSMWHVLDAMFATIHELETGRPLDGWLVDSQPKD